MLAVTEQTLPVILAPLLTDCLQRSTLLPDPFFKMWRSAMELEYTSRNRCGTSSRVCLRAGQPLRIADTSEGRRVLDSTIPKWLRSTLGRLNPATERACKNTAVQTIHFFVQPMIAPKKFGTELG